MAVDKLYWHTEPYLQDDLGALNVVKFLGYDIHCIRNGMSTGSLADHIYVIDQTAGTIRSGTAALAAGFIDKIEFIPNLKGALVSGVIGDVAAVTYNNANPNTVGYTPFPLNDITINTYTGEIVASTSTAAGYLKNFNFILNIIATSGAQIVTSKVRVHVHDSLVNTWLTPTTKTVISGNRSRVSLFAEFSSGIIGDITNHVGVSWLESAANLNSDPVTGVFAGTFDGTTPANNDVVLTANLNASSLLNSTASVVASATTTVKILDSWKTPVNLNDRPYAEWVIGPGKDKRNDVPNFLVIFDGAKSSDRNSAKLLIKNFRKKLINKPSKSPWNELVKNVNFWLLFLPSENRAITIKNEIVPIPTMEWRRTRKKYTGSLPKSPIINNTLLLDKWETTHFYADGPKKYEETQTETKRTGWRSLTELKGLLDSNLSKPAELLNIWDWVIKDTSKIVLDNNRYKSLPPALVSGNVFLSTLLYFIGYPTPDDAGESKADLIANKWDVLYDTPLTEPLVADHVYDLWKYYAERRLPNEVDNILGTAFGHRPIASIPDNDLAGPERGPLPQTFGINRRFLDGLLTNIRLGPSPTDPTTNEWSDKLNDESTAAWAKSFSHLGKDFSRLIILSTRTRTGGVQMRSDDPITGEFIGQGIFANLEVQPFHYPDIGTGRQKNIKERAFPTDINQGALGTLIHEMTHSFGLDDEYATRVTPKDANTPKYYKFPVINSFNLQKEKDLLITELDGAGDSFENNGALNGDKIKWRWPRIANAGSLKITPSINATNAAHFDISLTDGHELGFSVNEFVYLRKKGIEPVVLLDQLPSSHYSAKLKIESIDPVTKVITVSNLSNPADFLVDATHKSVLIKLVEALVPGVGTISAAGKIVTGVGTYFEAQVNPAGSTGLGGSFIIVGSDKIRVKDVTSNTKLELQDPFTAAVPVGTKFEILQRDSNSVATDSYKELLNYSVRMTINKNQKPMSTYPWVTDEMDGNVRQDPDTTQLIVDGTDSVFSLMRPSIISRQVVGLYKNGAEFTHAIFHPTGFCHMRSSKDPWKFNPTEKAHEQHISLFCPICRYILVDNLDPSKHSIIENSKTSHYPKI